MTSPKNKKENKNTTGGKNKTVKKKRSGKKDGSKKKTRKSRRIQDKKDKKKDEKFEDPFHGFLDLTMDGDNKNNENKSSDQDDEENMDPIDLILNSPLMVIDMSPKDNKDDDDWSLLNTPMTRPKRKRNGKQNDDDLYVTSLPPPLHPLKKKNKRGPYTRSTKRRKESKKPLPPMDSPFKFETFADMIKAVENPVNLVYPDICALQKIVPTMRRFNRLVGQDQLKKRLIGFCQYLTQPMARNDEMLNMCLFGGPGLGKTTFAQLIAEMFVELGLLPKTRHNGKDKFIIGTRSNMIGKYLGQTAPKTQEVIDRCIEEGKILLMDEAYQFGNSEKRDSYSKELIDTLNQNLSEKAGKFFVILAGYKEDVQRCFFAYNKGLERRFTDPFTLQAYSAAELRDIFLLKMKDQNLVPNDIDKLGPVDWWEKQKSTFKYFGGDIESLVVKLKITHAQRVFGLPEAYKGRIVQEDLDKALFHLKQGRTGSACGKITVVLEGSSFGGQEFQIEDSTTFDDLVRLSCDRFGREKFSDRAELRSSHGGRTVPFDRKKLVKKADGGALKDGDILYLRIPTLNVLILLENSKYKEQKIPIEPETTVGDLIVTACKVFNNEKMVDQAELRRSYGGKSISLERSRLVCKLPQLYDEDMLFLSIPTRTVLVLLEGSKFKKQEFEVSEDLTVEDLAKKACIAYKCEKFVKSTELRRVHGGEGRPLEKKDLVCKLRNLQNGDTLFLRAEPDDSPPSMYQ